MTGDINLHNQFRENPTQNVTRCGKGAPDFARMLTGTNSSRIISDTFGNKHLASVLFSRTDPVYPTHCQRKTQPTHPYQHPLCNAGRSFVTDKRRHGRRGGHRFCENVDGNQQFPYNFRHIRKQTSGDHVGHPYRLRRCWGCWWVHVKWSNLS